MKKQLRNAMLLSAALVAGNAWAEVTGTVAVAEGEGATLTIEWEQAITTLTGKTATAVKGSDEILVTNNTTKEIWSYTKDGSTPVITDLPTTPFAITCDEAGNIIFNNGGGATTGATTFYVLPAGSCDINDVKELTLTLPDGISEGRVDQLGRVLGNVLSDKGGWLTTAINTQTAVVSYHIANGKQIEAYPSLALPENAKLNTFYVTQPWGTNLDECLNASDPGMAVYVFSGNSSSFLGPNDDFDDWTSISRQQHRSAAGFDWFILGEETYYVYGARIEGRAATWCPGDFAIVRASDNKVVATYTSHDDTSSGLVTGSIVAYANEDGKSATIYRFNSLTGAAKLTFSLKEETPVVDPLYAVGSWCDWNPANPSKFAYADGKYTITLGTAEAPVDKFKMSTVKGDWDAFNAKAICVADDHVISEINKAYNLYMYAPTEIVFDKAAVWSIAVDLEAKTITALNCQTGVEDIVIDAAAPAEYYNLQGIRVAQPEAGQLYIVKQGNKVSKALVK